MNSRNGKASLGACRPIDWRPSLLAGSVARIRGLPESKEARGRRRRRLRERGRFLTARPGDDLADVRADNALA